jgi:hypothetical protein
MVLPALVRMDWDAMVVCRLCGLVNSVTVLWFVVHQRRQNVVADALYIFGAKRFCSFEGTHVQCYRKGNAG